MRLIVEGPDLAGKTTAAKRIAERLGLEYVKENVYGADVFDQTIRHLMLENVVIDRCYFTEALYARLDEGRRQMTNEELWSLSLLLEGSGTVVLVLCPSDDVLTERFKARGDPHQSLERVLRVAQAYREIKNEWWAPSDYIFYTEDPPNDSHLVDLARLLLSERVVSWLAHEAYEDAWGNPHPGNVVLVGDRRNSNRGLDQFHRPFLTRRRENCGGYLFELLRHAGLAPNDVLLINAHGLDGASKDPVRLDLFKPRAVVALGNNAADWCSTRADLCIEHPQYLYRFWHDFAKEFGESLRDDLSRSTSRASQNKS